MADYPIRGEIAVTRAAIDASTEAARQVVVLIAELAKAQAENERLRERLAALERMP